MALTEKTDDTSSDGFVEVERPETELTENRDESVEQEETEPTEQKTDSSEAAGAEASATLNASSLEEHNESTMGGDEQVHVCTNPSPSKESDEGSEKQKVGAGLLFGLSGLLLGGPFLGLLAGAGGAYVASDVDGPAGDAARQAGDFAVTTGAKVGEAAKEADEKHGIVDKIKETWSNGWGKVKEFDEEHKIGEKAKETMTGVKDKSVEFEAKHHWAQNILEGIQNGVNFLLGKVKDATSEPCGGDNKISS